MSEIGVFTPEQARLLWQDYQARRQLNPAISQNYPQPRKTIDRPTRRLQGKLDSTLAAATEFADDPSTATMSVWQKNSSGDMEDSGDNITVVNRFIHISVASGSVVKAEWIDNEWQLYAADCEA